MEGSSLLIFCYSNGGQTCHYGRQSVVDIFVTTLDCSLVKMKSSLLSRFLLFQWMVSQSLWKVVSFKIFVTLRDGRLVIMEGSLLSKFQPCHYGSQFVVEIFVTPMDGSLVIMEGCLLSRFLLLQWIVSCHYGRQFVVDILLLQWMAALSL